jgi:hypothetical protein
MQEHVYFTDQHNDMTLVIEWKKTMPKLAGECYLTLFDLPIFRF